MSTKEKKFSVVEDGDAKQETTVVAAQPTAVVSVENQQRNAIAHRAAWCKIRYGVGAWQPADGEPPAEIGSVYISRGSATGYRRLTGPGEANAVKFIGLFSREGLLEETGQDGPMPRRWRIGRPDPLNASRTPKTLKECLEFAAEAGLGPATTIADGVYQDSQRTKYKRVPAAGFSGICSPMLELFGLAKVPENFTSNDFDLVVIGGELYTPIVFEFARQHYAKAATGIKNIAARLYAKFRADPANKDKTWEFDMAKSPIVFRLGTTIMKRTVGNSTYPAPSLSLRTTDALDEEGVKDLLVYVQNCTVVAADEYGDEGGEL